MSLLHPHALSSSLSTVSPPHAASPSRLPPSPLNASDAAEVAQRMEAVQAELSTLPSSQHLDFLLTQLHSALTSLVHAQHEAQQHRATALHQQQKSAHLAHGCQRMQLRLNRLLQEAAGLKGDLQAIASEVEGPHGGVNGKEEKEANGHSHPTFTPHSPSDFHPADVTVSGAESSLSDWSDLSTLLSTTEAQLEVDRRQREKTGPSPAHTSATSHFPPSLSLTGAAASPYYHHEHTLTGAGKAAVQSILRLFASSASSMTLPQLQALAERVGRGGDGVGGGGAGEEDDSGDVWWVWQSHASEDEAGEVGMTAEDLQRVYEQEWDLDEDARRLHLD